MKSKIHALMVTLSLLTPLCSRGDVAAESGRASRYAGKLDPAATYANQCEFSVEIERVMFKLNSLKDKYKVVRIRVENRTVEPIKLSGAQDGIELESREGDVVRGTFNLPAQDGPMWDSMGEDLRRTLAYPLSIRGGKGEGENPRQAEVIYVYAFFPADKVSELPRSFRYTIQSKGRTVNLDPPPATKA